MINIFLYSYVDGSVSVNVYKVFGKANRIALAPFFSHALFVSHFLMLSLSLTSLFFRCLLLPFALFVSYFPMLSLSLTSSYSLCLSLSHALFFLSLYLLLSYAAFVSLFLVLASSLCDEGSYNSIWFVPYCVQGPYSKR
jgi:hypothetical protein